MGSILCLETSSRVCSAVIGSDGNMVACYESEQENAHSSALTGLIDQALHQAQMELSGLDAVAVSMGPGSYTGLRIGVATAKGFCYALNKPLISVPTLRAMALGILEQIKLHEPQGRAPDLVCPMLDARRMEVYCAVYDQSLNEIFPVSAQIINSGSFSDLLGKSRILFAGEGAFKCKPFLGINQNSFFLDDFKLSARFLYPQANEKFIRGEYENPAYFEPCYLKDFVAGKPRVKGLK
jgi:tRNA threonylcarbamoyladenosine biosynthesis protein TsaB